MKPTTKSHSDPVNPEGAKPAVKRVTRRQLLSWMGAAGVAVAAGVGGVSLLRRHETNLSIPSSARFQLPDQPNHNPAYRAWATPDQGVVLWTHKQGKDFAGYRFNPNGRLIWRLCDGQRTAAEIASKYSTQTGRDKQEAMHLLAQLQTLGIVVTGGYVVLSGAFPTPPKGGSYHPRLSANDPKTT